MLDDLPRWAFVGSVYDYGVGTDNEIIPDYADHCVDWVENEIDERKIR